MRKMFRKFIGLAGIASVLSLGVIGLEANAVTDPCLNDSSTAGCESPLYRDNTTQLVSGRNSTSSTPGDNVNDPEAAPTPVPPIDTPGDANWGNLKYMKGANVSIFDWSLPQVSSDLSGINANTVTLPIMVDIPSLTSSTFEMDQANFGRFVDAGKRLKKFGYSVVLEPFPYIDDGMGIETGWQPCDWSVPNSPSCTEFKDNWSSIVLQLTEAAQENGFYGVYIGSNFEQFEAVPAVSVFYSNLIDEMKAPVSEGGKGYEGQVIYRTNWWFSNEQLASKKTVQFFQDIDILAIAAYFEVTENHVATTTELKDFIVNGTNVWNRGQKLADQIEELHQSSGKPIIFGELGIIHYWGFFDMPWAFQPTESYQTFSDEAQRNWYQAWIETMNNYDWFYGWSIFAIGTGGTTNYQPVGEASLYLRTLNAQGNPAFWGIFQGWFK